MFVVLFLPILFLFISMLLIALTIKQQSVRTCCYLVTFALFYSSLLIIYASTPAGVNPW